MTDYYHIIKGFHHCSKAIKLPLERLTSTLEGWNRPSRKFTYTESPSYERKQAVSFTHQKWRGPYLKPSPMRGQIIRSPGDAEAYLSTIRTFKLNKPFT
jgi:hypothetical protein